MKNIICIAMALMISMPAMFAQQTKENSKSTDNTVILYVVRHGKTILNTMTRVQE